jgi:hypothetical protein
MFDLRWWAALGIVVVSATVAAEPAAPDPEAILKRADAPRDAFGEGVIGLRVVVNERGKKPLESRMEIFVKGSDSTLAVFVDGKQRGRKVLTTGDRVLLIVPGASRPVPVSKTQRLMGAASFGDIARLRFADEYEAKLRPVEETVPGPDGGTRCFVLDLTAKRKGTAYPIAVLWIGSDDGLARRLHLSLASGKDAKDVAFTRYDDKHRVMAMEIRDLIAGGGANVTQLSFESYEARPLDPALFTPDGARAAP